MAKGFRLQPKLYKLTFEDGDLDGLECTLEGVSLERFIELTTIADLLGTPEGRTAENIEAQFSTLGGLLAEWNLEDDNGPVEPSYDALKKFDFSYVQQIMQAYIQAFAAVPKDSNDDSSSGGTSEEASLGLAKSSRNLKNS